MPNFVRRLGKTWRDALTTVRFVRVTFGDFANPYNSVLIVSHENAAEQLALICERLNLAGIRTFTRSDVPFWKNKARFRSDMIDRAAAIVVLENEDLPRAAWLHMADVRAFLENKSNNERVAEPIIVVTRVGLNDLDYSFWTDIGEEPVGSMSAVPYADLSFRFANTSARLRFRDEVQHLMDLKVRGRILCDNAGDPIHVAPKECTVLSNQFSREIVIEHEGPLGFAVDYVEFDSAASSITLITPLRRRYLLDLKINEGARTALLATSDVAIIRLNDGRRVTGSLKRLVQTKTVPEMPAVLRMVTTMTNNSR